MNSKGTTMKTLNQVLVCAFNHKGHVLTANTYNLPYGSMLPEESQREAAVRILQEQTGFVIEQTDLQALMYDVIKTDTVDRHVLSYLCTKVLEAERGCEASFQSTQAFLENCKDYDYNHNALLCASELSTQLRLPWSKTCYTSVNQPKTEIELTEKEPKMNTKVRKGRYLELTTKLKDKQMKTETTNHKPLTLICGVKYLTREGKEVTLTVDEYCGEYVDHQLLGSNGWYYTKDGEVFAGQQHEMDIVQKEQPEQTSKPEMIKTTKETTPELVLEAGKSYYTANQGVVVLHTHSDPDDFYKFTGDNGYRYTEHGHCFYDDRHGYNIVSEYTEPKVQSQEQPSFLNEDLLIGHRSSTRSPVESQELYEREIRHKACTDAYYLGVKDGQSHSTPKQTSSKFYTADEVNTLNNQQYLDGFNFGYEAGLTSDNSLSTSEVQSLITQQSKVIFELESEISELKELTLYLKERSYISEVQDLRKAMFNRMTTKQKRLGKLVKLQSKLKRSK